MWLSEQKPAYIVHKYILLPFIASLNNYTCSLANINWSAYPECLLRPCKLTAREMMPVEGSKSAMEALTAASQYIPLAC